MHARTPEEVGAIVKDMDRLSDLLCRVVDMYDFVRATHPDPEFVRAASKAYGAMYEYMNVLNTNTGLYESLKRAMEIPEMAAGYSDEERTVAVLLLRDFEKSGIHLPAAARKKFVELSSRVAHLGPEFVNGMSPQKGQLRFESPRLRGMDPMVVRELSLNGIVTLPTTGMSANHVLCSVEDEEVRRELYVASHTSSKKQIRILEELLKTRAELARLTGRDSYGEAVLADKMAKSPEAVIKFLNALSEANKPAALAELEMLSSVKKGSGNRNPFGPWDRAFYNAKLSQILSSRHRAPDFLSSYFSLGTVMQGLSRLFTRLYGVRFVPRETSPGETWNDDVRRLDIIDETDGHIAVVYCDLFEREGKNPHPAHFTVRCAREITDEEYLASALDGEREDDGMASSRHPDGKLYQLPTIALLCDFTRGNPTLLGFREVQVLFHEMGHAIHSMLGRTSLHNVAGTRCATDWAELPSILMEHFAKSPAVMSLFARHYETDEPLPPQMVAETLQQDSLAAASETRWQLILAFLDQQYHSSLPLSPSFDSTAVYRDVEASYNLLNSVDGTSFQGFFGHLFVYGATYYSYLFDKAIAAKVWKEVFENDPIRRENGEKFKQEVLKWGGARSGWKCLAGVLDRRDLEDGGEKAMVEVGRWGCDL